MSGLTAELIRSQFDMSYEFAIYGVLFYHKEAHNEPGCTPLVGWLKPYMIPEILNIPVPEWILSQAPSDYINVTIDRFQYQMLV